MPRLSPTLKKWLISLVALTVLVVICDRFVDLSVAGFVKANMMRNPGWAQRSGRIPDLLFHLVLLTTMVAWSVYLVRARKGLYDRFTCFVLLVSWNTPAAYLMKIVLKPIFGRLNTRRWLAAPELYGFHWFRLEPGYEGFPSGHMLVVATLAAVLWRFYPRTRPYSVVLALCLGIALVATAFHFVSDLIAGAWVGVALEAGIFAILSRPGVISHGFHCAGRIETPSGKLR